ncbi:hypothetical protein JW935_05605 [candidate division KSB1 bacterium]|nr:hypothetical protein [candidate division KSB1 bacterium]
MNKIDTLKMGLSTNALVSYNKCCFQTNDVREPNGMENRILKLSDQIHSLGISSICIDWGKNKITVEVSAKILKEKYGQLINRYTFGDFVGAVNTSGIIKIDGNKLLNESEIYRVDVCENLRLEEELALYKNALAIRVMQDTKYEVRDYKSDGLVITPKNKTDNLRIVIYPKFKELTLARNRELRKYIDIEQFQSVLRIEVNIRKYAACRKLFDLEKGKSPCLSDILLSKKPVLMDLLNPYLEVNEDQKNITIPQLLFEGNKKPSEKIKQAGMMVILDCFGNDLLKVKNWLKSTVTHNPGRHLPGFIKTAHQQEKDWVNEFVREIRAGLEEGKSDGYIFEHH